MPKIRKCKLANKEYKDVDLRQFEDLIIDAVNRVLPNKYVEVFSDSFCTDVLNQREAVLLGKELSKIPELSSLGKEITIFRLFHGKICDSEKTATNKGGRLR